MDKLRILMVGPIGEASGGIRTLMLGLLAGPLAEQFDLRVFDNGKRTASDRHLLTGLMSQCLIFFRYIIALARHRPRVVHLHFGGHPDIFRKAMDVLPARLIGSRVILHSHSGDFAESLREYGRFATAFIRWISRRCRYIVVMSERTRAELSDLLPGVTIEVIPNGLSPGHLGELPTREDARQALGIPADIPLIANIGRMGVAKGMFDLVNAAAIVHEQYPDASWLAAGPDDQLEAGATEALQAEAVRLGLEDNITFLGPVNAEGRAELLAAADLFVMPSHSENFPMVLLEAMAARLPIVATETGAVPEITPDGDSALLIEIERPDRLAEAVAKLLSDRDLASKLGRTGNRRLADKFEIDGPVSSAWADLYRRAAGRAS